MRDEKERGQVLLIIVLVMVVSLTVGLAFITKSITNLRTSKEEASSQRALAAAEAGIEELIKANTVATIADSFSSNTTFTASSNESLGTSLLVNGGNIIPKDEGADVWLVPRRPPPDNNLPDFSTSWSGNLTVYWGSATDVCNSNPVVNTMAAIELVVISGPAGSPVLTRFAYDPCAPRISDNNFTAASTGGFEVDGKDFVFAKTTLITNGLIARVVPLYKSTQIGVSGNIALPSQGKVIVSTGDSSGTTRKINVFKGYPQLPIQYFSYGLFSP